MPQGVEKKEHEREFRHLTRRVKTSLLELIKTSPLK